MRGYEKTGILTTKDLRLPSQKQLEKGVAILECVQEIPCNPCVESCPVHAITMKDINAIFVVKITDKKAWVTLPYEFVPTPTVGDIVQAVDRTGKTRGSAVVKKVVRQGKTMVVTIEIESRLAMDIRNIKV
jgi:ferredoxin